ncbi:uncharacterized protein LOC114526522 [Dendronephthya gigantea]|uniref:uncharacterized protein LOC114526522 n=1 Tax=Dendronephthya gigantea TaxID=151771 RepID=UPI00106AF632|nr:uncharacterized protein LOC114526522 [Dendronephthya gigantea]
MAKLDSLKLLLAKKPIDILTVSESWLKPSILDSEVSIDGYSCVRKDRLGKVGGGSLIYVREGIPFRFVVELSLASAELCSIEILRPKAKKVIVWSIYRPPNGKVEQFVNELNELLLNVADKDELLVLGDFNISWNAKSAVDKALKRKLKNLANGHGLEQIIDQPTRVTEKSSTVLDLIFTNFPHRIIDHGIVDPSLSDHSMVFCVVKACVIKAPGKTIEFRSYKRYQKRNFIQDLRSADWSVVDDEPTVDLAVLAWNNLFLSIANKHAPIKTTRIKGSKLPWLTTELMDAMRKRDFYRKMAKKSNLQRHWTLYKDLRNFVNSEVKRCKAEYYTRLIDENKQNHSALWKTLNEVTCRKKCESVSCIESDASMLAQKFKESLIILLPSSSTVTADDSNSTFTFMPVPKEFVLMELKRLKTNKAIGLDGISARLLKDSATRKRTLKFDSSNPNWRNDLRDELLHHDIEDELSILEDKELPMGQQDAECGMESAQSSIKTVREAMEFGDELRKFAQFNEHQELSLAMSRVDDLLSQIKLSSPQQQTKIHDYFSAV